MPGSHYLCVSSVLMAQIAPSGGFPMGVPAFAAERSLSKSASLSTIGELDGSLAAEVFPADELAKAKAEWERRLNECPAEHRMGAPASRSVN